MPKYKQSKMDRKDESMGIKDYMHGYESGKNDRYDNPARGKAMGHDKSPMGVNAMPGKHDVGRVKHKSHEYRGYDSKAFEYKY